jgi:streptogramin lyase
MSINIVSGNERDPINRMIQGSGPLPFAALVQTPKQFMRLRAITTALVFCLSAAVSATRPAPSKSKIETFAGAGRAGYAGDGGQATKAQLDNPFGVVRGPDGALYICDTMNHVIRKVDRNGVITTVAGAGKKGYSGDGGPALDAALNEPYEIRFNKQGDMFFVERLNHVVRRVDAKTRIITTVAGSGKAGFSGDGGAATQATLDQPHSIQFDARGDLYICDILNHRIRKVDMKTGVITTFAGTGDKKPTPDGAKIAGTPLNGPRAIDFDRRGDMWLALREGNAVYRLDMKAGSVHHVAGTGEKGFTGNGAAAKLATLSGPKGLSVAPNGDIYLADTESHSIRMIDIRKQTIELITGTGAKGDGADGDPLSCQMARPHGVFVDRDGSIFIGDSEAHRVRVIRIGAASGSERSSIK